ncbi:MAG TPA: GNAT family N-acetyltransferase [Mycobacteriales bacterium]|nr:GNAT family N-acetyltransferase [Mycobacteriales bacterium]
MTRTPLQRQRTAAWRVWQADVATRPGGDWADLGGVAVHTTGIPVRHWNGAHLTHAEGLQHVDEVDAWFAARAMPWGLLVPTELGLTPRGLEQVTVQRVMLRDLDDLPAVTGPALRWDAGEDAAVVQAAAFGDGLEQTLGFVGPKLLNAACGVVTGYDGSRPVSTATVVVVDGVAAVFGVATLPSYQRRGWGRALTLAVLHEGARRGADLAYLNPSDSGEPVYRALGFTDAPGLAVWAPREP